MFYALREKFLKSLLKVNFENPNYCFLVFDQDSKHNSVIWVTTDRKLADDLANQTSDIINDVHTIKNPQNAFYGMIEVVELVIK